MATLVQVGEANCREVGPICPSANILQLVLARFSASVWSDTSMQGCRWSCLSPLSCLVLSLGWTVGPALERCLLNW